MAAPTPPTLVAGKSYITVDSTGLGTFAYLVFDQSLDGAPGILPTNSAFTLQVNGVTTTLTGTPTLAQGVAEPTSTAFNTVRLQLANPIQGGQTVIVSYKDPTTGNDTKSVLQALDGTDAASFYTQAVKNNALSDTTAPVFDTNATNTKIDTDTKTIKLNFGETLDPNNPPAATAFTVQVNRVATAVDTVKVQEQDVYLTLKGITSGLDTKRVDIAYKDPTTGNDAKAIQDVYGNDVANFTHFLVPTADTAPISVSSTATGSTVKLTFDQNLDSVNLPATSTFNDVRVNGVKTTVTKVAVAGKDLILSLDPKTATDLENKRVEINYTEPKAGLDDAAAIQNIYGNDAGATTGKLSFTVTPGAMTQLTPPTMSIVTQTGEGTPYAGFAFDSAVDTSVKESDLLSLFSATLNGKTAKVVGVKLAADGLSAQVYLDSPILKNDVVSIKYTDKTTGDDTGVLQSVYSPTSGGADVATRTYTLTGLLDNNKVAPTLDKAELINSKQIALTFTEGGTSLDAMQNKLDQGHLPPLTAFSVTQNGVKLVVKSFDVPTNNPKGNPSNDTVLLTLDKDVTNIGSITVGYTAAKDPTTLQDNAGNDIASFSAPVTVKPLVLEAGTDNVNVAGPGGINGLFSTDAADVISGNIETGTLGLTDVINGAGGTDTLKITGALSAALTTFLDPTKLSNVEILDLVNPGNNAVDVSAYADRGVTTLQIEQAELLNAKTITTGSGTNTLNLATTAGDAVAGDNTWAAGNASALNLALNGYQSGVSAAAAKGLTITGATTTVLNIASSTANNQLGLLDSPDNTNTHNITGDKALAYKIAAGDLAKLTTINAATNTGGVNVDTSAGPVNAAFNFTGTKANDTLTLSRASLGALTAGTQLNGGDGTGDVLAFGDAGAFSPKSIANLNTVKGFETIQFAAGSSANLAVLTNTAIKTIGVTSGTFVGNSKSAFNVDLSSDIAGTLTLKNIIGETTTSVALNNTSGAAHTLAGLALKGITNVNISSTGTAKNEVTAVNNMENSSFAIKGTADLKLSLSNANTVGNKVDASGFGAKLELKASSGGDIITGSKQADTFDFTQAKASDTLDTITTLNGITKGDKLTVGGTNSTLAKATVTATNLYDALNEVAATNGAKWFQFDKNTYIINDTANDAAFDPTDIVVKIAGTVDLSSSTYAAGTLTY